MDGLVVVDASLAVKWLVREVYTEQAFTLARSWVGAGVRPIAPYLMPVEVANALYHKAAQHQLSWEVAIQLLDGLIGAGIQLQEPIGLHPRAVQLAGSLQQGVVYDAHYLALAEMLDCEMWTADERFYRAANSQFPRIHWLGEV